MVVVGFAVAGAGAHHWAAARLDSNGRLDTPFDSDGRATWSVPACSSTGSAWDVGLQADGKILTTGYCGATPGTTRTCTRPV